MLARPLILALFALGIARYYGITLLDWMFAIFSVVSTSGAAVLTIIWELLHPTSDGSQQYLPDLHQTILNVTRDATRVADLLEDFFAQQYHDDPALKDKFMAYLTAQANTSYSVVDNQLSWILWLYGLLWMPLLVVLCFVRASRLSRPAQSEGSRTPAGAGLQCTAPDQATASLTAASMHGSTQCSLTQKQGSLRASGQRGVYEPPRAATDASSMRALRRSATTAVPLHNTWDAQQQQQQKLASSASMPARLLTRSSSLKVGSGTSRLPTAFETDVRLVDQCSEARGSAGASIRSARSVVVHHQQTAAIAEPIFNWQMVS